MADNGRLFLVLLRVCLLVVLANCITGSTVSDLQDLDDREDVAYHEVQSSPQDSILDQIAKVNERSDQNFYEGDIVLTKSDSARVDLSNTGDVDAKFEGISKRNAMRNREKVWQNKVVPYLIDSQLKSVTSVIQSAFNEFHSRTCVKFVPRTNEEKWIRIVKKPGCWSFVGKTSSKGAQEVSIGNGCQYKGIVMHELLHAIGFWHEQSRPDRNQYIEILWENIQNGMEHNFNKYSHGEIDTLKAPYDFESLMHYGKYSFSVNGKPTILAITNPSQSLGQRNGFTQIDILEVNSLYDCKGPSDGWSSWSDYGPCDNCKKVRQRYCSSLDGSKCPGVNAEGVQEQVVTCAAKECKAPIDGHWGRWSKWSQCSATCGQGTRTRTRRCSDPPAQNGGKPCVGVSTQSTTCKMRTCGLGPDACEFEVDMCRWQQTNPNNKYKWYRRHGGTPSRDTGPDGDITKSLKGQGYYIYAEASGIPKGNTTELQSKTFSATSDRCLQFFYNMYGNDIGTLNVYVMDAKTGTKKTVFSKSGNQGQKWYGVETTFTSPNDYKILFEAVCGDSYKSDIALDDIIFDDGKCQGQTTPKPTTARQSTVFPTTSQFSTKSPSTALPSTATSTGATRSTTAFPTTASQTTAKPTTGNPSTARSTTAKQTTMGPTTANLSTMPPSTSSPTTTPPTTAYPSTTQYSTVVPTRLPTTPGQGDDCDFDRNFCYWKNGGRTSKYPWRRNSYSTPSTDTGPSRDHTTGRGYYIYVETSNMSGANQTATLVSKTFPPFCIRCMNFYYHMYGTSMGTLNVYMRKIDINKQYKIFTKTGNQGNQWHSAMVSFRSSYKYKIIFESVRGFSYTSDIAIDDISFTDGPCPTQRVPSTAGPLTTQRFTMTLPSTTVAPTTFPTTSGKANDCNFDQNMCYWTQGPRTNSYPWKRIRGGTSSSKTGPSRDHTSGSGYYVYVETSKPARKGETATLVSKVFPPTPAGHCMSFFYHMYGATMGSLNVYIRRLNFNAKIKIFTRSGNQGNKWHGASVTIRSSYRHMIIFESVTGSSYTSDIAIDDVSFVNGPCSPTREMCTFDQNFCSWRNGGGTNKYPWKRISFKTKSHGTGPSGDHTTGSGYYVYVETSKPARKGQTATLVSRVFPPASAGRCMSFFYHMYGATMGSLNVYIRRLHSNAKTKIFTRSGNQGNKWHRASVTIQAAYSYRVIIESVRGSSYTSDIAIDDISFVNAPCPIRCNFDQSYCLWSKGIGSSHYTWTRRSGGTPSPKTGPSKDHTTGTGYYVYVETSNPARKGQTATLISRVFLPTPAGRCMSFFYHMYGATMGSLNVYIRRLHSNAKTKIFTRSGNQGNKWHGASVTIRSSIAYKIVFESVRGYSYESDIAIDDITIAKGICSTNAARAV